MRRAFACRVGLFVLSLLLPALAFAQSGSGIAGVVKDSSGAVLPGVTVEAASPALIEKVRTVVTDGEGQYKIVGLVPGTYSVTFTLTGFNTSQAGGRRADGVLHGDRQRRSAGRLAARKPSPSPARRRPSTSRTSSSSG